MPATTDDTSGRASDHTESFARSMLAALHAAIEALRLGFTSTLGGRTVLFGRCLFFCLLMLVLSALWETVAAERIAGAIALPPGGFTLYVGVTEWITLAVPALYLRLEDDIRGGSLDTHLLRPKSYLLQTLAHGFGAGLARLTALGLTALALLAVSDQPWPQVHTFALLLVLGPLALLVGLLLYAIAGLTAFWARRTLPFQLVIQKFMFLLGGLFAPITLYPEAFSGFALCTPFAAHLYWAGAQMLEPSTTLALQGIAWQLAWILVLSAVCFAMWRSGVRKLVQQGGL